MIMRFIEIAGIIVLFIGLSVALFIDIPKQWAIFPMIVCFAGMVHDAKEFESD